MDINRLCPGCMREVDDGIQRMRVREEAPQRSGEAPNQRKCPYCGFCMDTYKQNARCLPINTILAGKYLVGAVLGEGGFGITYIGYDLNMQTRIAIKEYFPVELVSRDTTSMTGDRVISMSGDKGATYRQGLKKYVTEAQNVSQFSEIPGVVSVKDFFYENETAYIVMEYIDGISLKDYLKERGGRLSEEESLAIMKPVLEALMKVHEAGIIHRDISPDNIMLTFRSAWDNGNIRGYGNVTAHDGATGHGNATGPAGHGNTAGYGTVTEYGAAEQRGISAEDTDADRPAPSGQAAAGRESVAARMAHGESGASDMVAKGDGAASDIASVKLIDFGAARMTAKNDQKSLTIILKHGYAPEEQYRTHGEQGPWTDVYAVCAVLYRMLTGQPPVPAMDRMFQDGLKSFDDLNTKVSRNTQAAILKGLAVKKEDRIQSIQELMQALYEGKAIRQKLFAQRKFRIAAALVGIAIAGAAVAMAASMHKKDSEQPSDQLAAVEEVPDAGTAPEPSEPDTENPDSAQNPSEAADGQGEMVIMEPEAPEEDLGEPIVIPTPQTSLAAGDSHMIFRKDDGTVQTLGSNEYGQREVEDWTHIAAVAGGYTFTAGLREDGRVVIAGELESRDEVESWQDIVAIAATWEYIFGLTKEGNIRSNMNFGGRSDYYDWVGIKAIAASGWSLCALTSQGEVRTVPVSESTSPLPVTGWTDVEQIVCAQCSVFGITETGDVRCALIFEDSTGGAHHFENMDSFHDIVQLFSDAGLSQYGVTKGGTLCVGGSGFEDSPYDPAGKYRLEMSRWTDMAGIIGMEYDGRYAGLKKDGSLVKLIENYGNSTPESMENMEWITEVDSGNLIGTTRDGQLRTYGTKIDFSANMTEMTDVRKVFELSALYNSVIVLTSDGQMKPYRDDLGFSQENGPEYFCWDDCVHMEGEKEGSYCAGLMADGTVKIIYARTEDEQSMHGLARAQEWQGIVQVALEHGWGSCIYGLRTDETIVSAEFNGATNNETEDWTDISAIFSGYDCIGAAKEDGTVIFTNAGDNDCGQKNTFGWTGISKLAIGRYHTVGLKGDGTVVATGLNLSGQCEVEDWTDIVYVEAGNNCTIGIKADGSLVTAGEVGW